ncbi:MAG TPA: hypothetical protein VF042_16935, partial [Gemmatimonadaceae bacterium]
DQVAKPGRAFAMWHTSGSFATLIPALADISALDLATLDNLCAPGLAMRPQRRVNRMIALFSAAPHGSIQGILKGLRFSNADAAWIGSVAAAWQTLRDDMRNAMMQEPTPSDASLRRWAAEAGRTRLASVLRIAGARWTAERQAGIAAPSSEAVMSVYRRAVRTAYRDPIEIGDLAVNGSDLEKLGIRGPAVGQTLRSLLETVINDPAANSREKLLEAVKGQPQHGR